MLEICIQTSYDQNFQLILKSYLPVVLGTTLKINVDIDIQVYQRDFQVHQIDTQVHQIGGLREIRTSGWQQGLNINDWILFSAFIAGIYYHQLLKLLFTSVITLSFIKPKQDLH